MGGLAVIWLAACVSATVPVRAAVHVPGGECGPVEEHELSAAFWSQYDTRRRGGCDDLAFGLVGDDGTCWYFPQLCGPVPTDDPFFRRDPGDPAIDPSSCGTSGCPFQ